MNTNRDFFFISYSQNDNVIQDDLLFFCNHHVNYWIDKEGMRVTDDSWIERAQNTIMNEHCKGAVFYLSVHSLSSCAVEKEIDIVSNKRNQYPGFFVFAVLVEGLSIPHLIKKLYDMTDDSELASVLPLSRIVKIISMFSDEKIYLSRQIEYLDTYYKKFLINLSESGVVDDRKSLEYKLISIGKLDAYGRYSFGMFYSSETVQYGYVHLYKTKTFEEKNGIWYIKLDNGIVHKAEPIKWIILDYCDGVMRLVSERVLEKIPGKDIDTWLNTDFLSLAFSEEERTLLESPIRTFTYDEYIHYNDQCDINPTAGSFWLNSINKRNESNMLMCVKGNSIDQNGYRKDKKNGIRPLIEICVKNILGEQDNG